MRWYHQSQRRTNQSEHRVASWFPLKIRGKRQITTGGRFPVVSGGRQEVVQVGNAGNSKILMKHNEMHHGGSTGFLQQ